jgi:hypothetical protein
MGLTVAASSMLAALGVAPTTAHAQSADPASATAGAYVTVLTPFPGSSYEGSKQIEVSAFYQDTAAGGGISSVEILIDGQSAATKRLDRPELRGVVSFLIDPSTLDSGTHQILIRVASVSGDTAKVRTSIKYNGASGISNRRDPNIDGINLTAGISVISPRAMDHISGTVTIKVNAVDPSGKSPYVSLFIDKVFKTLRNYPPYSFDWDTTRIANGWHTIEVSGFNDDNQIGKTDPIRVYVNNGGGETTIDRGLTDEPSTPKPAPAAPAAPKPAPVDAMPAGDAQLAKAPLTAPAIGSTSPDQLASAAISGGKISTATLLDAPFLLKQAAPAPEDTNPTTPAKLARPARRDAKVVVATPEKLASANLAGVLTPDVLLSSPFLTHQAAPAALANVKASTATPSLPDAEIISTTPAASLHIEPTNVAPDVAPQQKPIAAANLARPTRSAPATAVPQRMAHASAEGTVVVASAISGPEMTKFAEAPKPVAPATLAKPGKASAAGTTSSTSQKIAHTNVEGSFVVASAISGPEITKIAETPRPMAPASLAKPGRASAKTSLPEMPMAASVVTTHIDTATNAEAPQLSKIAEAPKPMAPAALAHGKNPAVALKLPMPEMASANVDTLVSPEVMATAPFLKPQAEPRSAEVAPVKPVVKPATAAPAAKPAVQAEAALAKAPAAKPSVNLGAQLLASAGFTPATVSAEVMLNAPFLGKQAAPARVIDPSSASLASAKSAAPSVKLDSPSLTKIAHAIASPEAIVAFSAPDVHPVAAPVAPPKPIGAPSLAKSHDKTTATMPVQVKMAAAGVTVSPDGSGVLETPHLTPMHIDMTNVPHASVVVARPQTGLFSASVRQRVAGQYEVVMNDHPLSLERPIQDHGNVLCAPIRRIFESQGGMLQWSSKTRSVRALTPTKDVQLQIGSTAAKINNQDQKLTTAPYINGGRTMIPIGFLPMALDVTVTYDAVSGHLVINSKD